MFLLQVLDFCVLLIKHSWHIFNELYFPSAIKLWTVSIVCGYFIESTFFSMYFYNDLSFFCWAVGFSFFTHTFIILSFQFRVQPPGVIIMTMPMGTAEFPPPRPTSGATIAPMKYENDPRNAEALPAE